MAIPAQQSCCLRLELVGISDRLRSHLKHLFITKNINKLLKINNIYIGLQDEPLVNKNDIDELAGKSVIFAQLFVWYYYLLQK